MKPWALRGAGVPRRLLRLAFGVVVIALFAYVGGSTTHGQGRALVIQVNSVLDEPDIGPGDGICDTFSGRCTLRAAIMEANAREGDESIRLPEGTFTLTRPGQREDAAFTGDLDITDVGNTITILGAGGNVSGGSKIDGGQLDRVFEVHANARLEIEEVWIQNGKVSGSFTRPAAEADGGGIRVASGGALALRQTVLWENQARNGAALSIDNGAAGPGAAALIGSALELGTAQHNGGAIENRGFLSIEGGQILRNEADAGGGIINYAQATLTNVVVGDNAAGSGGGVRNAGADAELVLTQGSVNSNTASVEGGGLWVEGTATLTDVRVFQNDAGAGGGLLTNGQATLTVQGGEFSSNVATLGDGGGVLHRSGSGSFEGATFESNEAMGNGGGVASFSQLTLRDATITGNVSGLHGGGVFDQGLATIVSSRIAGNRGSFAGGVELRGDGSQVSDTTIEGNGEGDCGALVSRGVGVRLLRTVVEANRTGDNSVVCLFGGTLVVEDSAIVRNSSVFTPLPAIGIADQARLELRNSTVSGNDGAAIDVRGMLISSHATVAGNGGTGVVLEFGSSWSAQNTLLSGNAEACGFFGGGPVMSLGGNLADDASCALGHATDQEGVDASLGPLADNGGPTPTHALLPGSPAINAGVESPVFLDQRGALRIGQPDIGAFEFQGADTDGDGFDPIDAGGTDCDDRDAAVYPGAEEIAGDGIDQDCDGADLPGASSEVGGSLAAGFSTLVFPGSNGTPIENVTAALGSADAVFRFDPASQSWDTYRPQAPIPLLNTLRTVNAGDVLFVRLPAGAGVDWAWPDSLPAGPVAVTLAPGFTFVGYTGAAVSLDALFAGLDGVTAVFRFDAATQQYDTYRPGRPAAFSTFTEVARLDGLFVLNEGPTTTLTWEQVGGAAAPSVLSYPDFLNRDGLVLGGSADVAIGAEGQAVIRLTDAASQAGAMFASVALGADGTFGTAFQFQITNSGGAPDPGDQILGADGIAFVLQAAGADALGTSGFGMGYQGIAPSLVIEFDTWRNGGSEPDGNHLGINLNGSVESDFVFPLSRTINDGLPWSVWVDYDGASQTLEIRVWPLPVRPAAPIVTYQVDLLAVLGTRDVFAGFTSGTGGATGYHDVLSWLFVGGP